MAVGTTHSRLALMSPFGRVSVATTSPRLLASEEKSAAMSPSCSPSVAMPMSNSSTIPVSNVAVERSS